MKTFPVIDNNTQQKIGFEIENAYILPRTITVVLKNLTGVSDVQLIGSFSTNTDVRVSFKYLGKNYTVLEPFGDNSRYLVSPDSTAESSGAISNIESLFKNYEPPLWRKVVGDILTLRPLLWVLGR